MSTFQRRHKVLESLIRSWKHGHEVVDQGVELVPKTKRAQTTERLQEESLTGNTEERELWINNFPMSEAKDRVQNTKQACQLFIENTAENLKEDNVNINDDDRDGKNTVTHGHWCHCCTLYNKHVPD